MKHYQKIKLAFIAATLVVVGFGVWAALDNRYNSKTTDCGQIRRHFAPVNFQNNGVINLSNSDYNKLNDCFISAYKHGQSAKIIYVEQGVDTSKTDTYITSKGKLTDQYQFNGLIQPSKPPTTAICSPPKISGLIEIDCSAGGGSDNSFSTVILQTN